VLHDGDFVGRSDIERSLGTGGPVGVGSFCTDVIDLRLLFSDEGVGQTAGILYPRELTLQIS